MRYTLPNLIIGIIIADIVFFSALKAPIAKNIHPLILIIPSALIAFFIMVTFFVLLHKQRSKKAPDTNESAR